MSDALIYILQSSSNHMYYIGSTGDVQRRLRDHNDGKVVATRNKGPWQVKMQQRFTDMTRARKMEWRLKRQKSRALIERIINDGYITMTDNTGN